MKKYEFIDHTADIAVKAYGDTLEEAFAAAAEAMFDIIIGGAEIGMEKNISFAVESIDVEGLLVNFLSRLIVLHETEYLVLGAFKIKFTGDNRLEATASGEKYDEKKHGPGEHVKGVSYHMMDIYDGKGKKNSYVQVLFDI
ncbi:MAG: archease [candidate division Zixibacteria bacterium]|nr:archease [candidate division Zixibacteria bacterium]